MRILAVNSLVSRIRSAEKRPGVGSAAQTGAFLPGILRGWGGWALVVGCALAHLPGCIGTGRREKGALARSLLAIRSLKGGGFLGEQQSAWVDGREGLTAGFNLGGITHRSHPLRPAVRRVSWRAWVGTGRLIFCGQALVVKLKLLMARMHCSSAVRICRAISIMIEHAPINELGRD